eukprot:TRINITY_DN49644_c0_g1_i1.p1 TRINITY_DN49644_c0_g1~~TRINITY_DN49644_c0_g1_i1.p1  ORF type:complete len:117 (+),score=13.67 TRINITY_DN49644_c0_g1_i1:38-388(+)
MACNGSQSSFPCSRDALLAKFVGEGVVASKEPLARPTKELDGVSVPLTDYASATIAGIAVHSQLISQGVGPDPPEEPKVRLVRTACLHGPRANACLQGKEQRRAWHQDGPNPLLQG